MKYKEGEWWLDRIDWMYMWGLMAKDNGKKGIIWGRDPNNCLKQKTDNKITQFYSMAEATHWNLHKRFRRLTKKEVLAGMI